MDPQIVEKFEKSTVVVLDVAGTTTSKTFVEETLFPFAKKHAKEFLESSWDTADVQEALKLLDTEITADKKDELVSFILAELEKSSANEGIKKIQGLVYRQGYEKGDIKGHVYSDVAEVLPQLVAAGKKVCVFSTGSCESQRLLFTKSTEGDLSAHIAEYFDTEIGAKTDAASFGKLAEKLAVKAEEIVFLTDLEEEAKAAKEAGITAILVARDAEVVPTEGAVFATIKTFADLPLKDKIKRKLDAPEEETPAKVAKVDEAGDAGKPEEAAAEVTSSETEVKAEDKPVEAEKTETAAVADTKVESTTAETEKTESAENGSTETTNGKSAEEGEKSDVEKIAEMKEAVKAAASTEVANGKEVEEPTIEVSV